MTVRGVRALIVWKRRLLIFLLFIFYFLQTIYLDLPRLSCLSDDEWIAPCLLLTKECPPTGPTLIPIENGEAFKLTALEPAPWVVKSTCEFKLFGGGYILIYNLFMDFYIIHGLILCLLSLSK